MKPELTELKILQLGAEALFTLMPRLPQPKKYLIIKQK
jgi:hypothetical protein